MSRSITVRETNDTEPPTAPTTVKERETPVAPTVAHPAKPAKPTQSKPKSSLKGPILIGFIVTVAAAIIYVNL